jgi:hypothetical protein
MSDDEAIKEILDRGQVSPDLQSKYLRNIRDLFLIGGKTLLLKEYRHAAIAIGSAGFFPGFSHLFSMLV